MALELFGFRIGKVDEQKDSVVSFAPPEPDDGSLTIAQGGVFGTTVDLEGTAKNESALITKYREMLLQPECEKAIDDIVNEAIVGDNKEQSVQIILEDTELPDIIKTKINEEFDTVLSLLHFNTKSYSIFRDWYVDGRLYYHVMIDTDNPRAGIKELRYIDPRKIKKIRSEKRDNTNPNYITKTILNKKYDEYFIYQPTGIGTNTEGIKIAVDSIAYSHSGVLDQRNYMVLSYLHKAIKPLNQLRMLEDATVIYRLARAPERRIFYIDVGNLPKGKAEQYLRDMMAKHKNKLVYDAETGAVRDDRKFLTMLEDYWLPRREGGRGTEITTLPGGQNLGEMDDVLYFRKKLYESLNVPTSRLESDSQFNMGRASEITRDELKFSKFVFRLRQKFSEMFFIILEKQLLLKGIMTKQEWNEVKDKIYFDYLQDNHFAELKEAELTQNRLTVLADADQYAGKYFSDMWIRKNVLRMTEDEIKDIKTQIEDEEPEDDGEDDEDSFESKQI
jgi:hypothetical protein|tara:strand:+ start:1523 stop:3034 length:1512 start_codon:yes stop_codon:yes gene_type:complete